MESAVNLGPCAALQDYMFSRVIMGKLASALASTSADLQGVNPQADPGVKAFYTQATNCWCRRALALEFGDGSGGNIMPVQSGDFGRKLPNILICRCACSKASMPKPFVPMLIRKGGRQALCAPPQQVRIALTNPLSANFPLPGRDYHHAPYFSDESSACPIINSFY